MIATRQVIARLVLGISGLGLVPALRCRLERGTRGRGSLEARRLEADRGEPGVHGDGGADVGPQDPRAGVHPGRGRRDVSTSGTPAMTTTGRRPCRWATRPRADGTHWSRDPQNPIFTDSWVEDMCVVKQDGTFQMFAEGKNDIAHRLTSTDGLHWTDQGSLDIRKTDGTPIAPGPYGTPDRLVRERDLVPLLRARRPRASGWRPRRT